MVPVTIVAVFDGYKLYEAFINLAYIDDTRQETLSPSYSAVIPADVTRPHWPFFPFLASSFLLCGMRYDVSHPYKAPAPNTMAAPIFISPPIWLPKIQMLNMKLTNLRMFKTIVTVTADVFALSMLTPVMQSNCVTALAVR